MRLHTILIAVVNSTVIYQRAGLKAQLPIIDPAQEHKYTKTKH